MRKIPLKKQSVLAIRSLCLFFLFFGLTGCGYPFASISDKGILPSSFTQKWIPPKHGEKKIKELNYSEPIDPAILTEEISLGEAIGFALQNNPSTSMSWASIQSAAAELGLAREDYFPKIDLSADVSRSRSTLAIPPNTTLSQWITDYGPQANIQYTVWDFGTRFAKSRKALQALFAVAWSYNQELQNIIRLITNDYYDYLYQKAALFDRERDVSDSRLILEAAEKKLKTGVSDITDLVQAKTVYLQSLLNEVSQKDFTENSLVTLVTDMGMRSNLSLKTQEFPENLPGKEYLVNIDQFMEIAIRQRPELLQYKNEVLSKKAALTEARLNPLPKVLGQLDMEYRASYHAYSPYFNLNAMFKANFPFFEGFFYRNQIRSAKAALKRAEAAMKQEQDQILKEVALFYNNYKNAQEKILYSKAFLEASLEEFQVTLGNYKVGTGDIINVMQAQTSLSDARSKYTEAVKDLFTSLTNLAHASGSLAFPTDESLFQWQHIYQFNAEDLP